MSDTVPIGKKILKLILDRSYHGHNEGCFDCAEINEAVDHYINRDKVKPEICGQCRSPDIACDLSDGSWYCDDCGWIAGQLIKLSELEQEGSKDKTEEVSDA